MKMVVQIVSERAESFTGKRGKVNQHVVACLDTDGEQPFINTFDYVLSAEEEQKYSGKLQGKKAQLAIINFEPAFGGRLRAKGALVSVS